MARLFRPQSLRSLSYSGAAAVHALLPQPDGRRRGPERAGGDRGSRPLADIAPRDPHAGRIADDRHHRAHRIVSRRCRHGAPRRDFRILHDSGRLPEKSDQQPRTDHHLLLQHDLFRARHDDVQGIQDRCRDHKGGPRADHPREQGHRRVVGHGPHPATPCLWPSPASCCRRRPWQ